MCLSPPSQFLQNKINWDRNAIIQTNQILLKDRQLSQLKNIISMKTLKMEHQDKFKQKLSKEVLLLKLPNTFKFKETTRNHKQLLDLISSKELSIE